MFHRLETACLPALNKAAEARYPFLPTALAAAATACVLIVVGAVFGFPDSELLDSFAP